LFAVAAVLTAFIFVINVSLSRPLVDALLFSLAIAVGIAPEMMPAIVTVSLSAGSKALAAKKVLVKRLVAIEDLGNIEILFTDKTGTLTEGLVTFDRALDAAGHGSGHSLLLGLVCNEAAVTAGKPTGGNALDQAVWTAADEGAAATAGAWQKLDVLPFDHDRQLASVLATDPGGRRLVTVKGAPRWYLAGAYTSPTVPGRCWRHCFPPEPGWWPWRPARPRAPRPYRRQRAKADARGIPDVRRPAEGRRRGLHRPARTAGRAGEDHHRGQRPGSSHGVRADRGELRGSAQRRRDRIARRRPARGSDPGHDRVRPDHPGPEVTDHQGRAPHREGRGVPGRRGERRGGTASRRRRDLSRLGTDVAKEAADVVLLDKDLGVLAEGVVEGRRIFANTMKYVLMATSSNFGNMFSAVGASVFLSFLPMLPSQILLNNLLYNTGQLVIPTDRVDPEALARPAAWDMRFIRHFMSVFGPVSSVFDFLTFWIMLALLHAGHTEFRTGWFVESIATQTLVVYVIRTWRIPFFKEPP
jgi:Mg2+-importing ATPase